MVIYIHLKVVGTIWDSHGGNFDSSGDHLGEILDRLVDIWRIGWSSGHIQGHHEFQEGPRAVHVLKMTRFIVFFWHTNEGHVTPKYASMDAYLGVMLGSFGTIGSHLGNPPCHLGMLFCYLGQIGDRQKAQEGL